MIIYNILSEFSQEKRGALTMRPARLTDMPGIAVDRVGTEADRRAAEDPSILRLENLDTDLRPPAAAIAATQAAAERDDCNSYLPFLGQDPLRQAAAAHVGRRAGLDYDWQSQVIVTAGGLNGILVTLLATIDVGDDVILTDPTYIGMINRVRLAGGVPKLVPFVREAGEWRLDLDALRAAVTTKTRAFLIMSPSMPSGAVLTQAEWTAIAELSAEADAWLIFNAAMERIVYDGREAIHPAGLPEMAGRTITVGSASKELRMIGWRVGWVVGPAAVMPDIGLVSISDVVTQVGIGQGAAAAALAEPERDVADAVAEWQRRRDVIVAELGDLPLTPAAGSWSMLLDVGALGLDSETASQRLMDIGRIAATPMVNWGVVNGDRFIRFVFSNEPVDRLTGIGERVRTALFR